KEFPSEIAELASMSMELITMSRWNVYFDNEEELTRAKRVHLEDILKILPWIALIDKFQHWIYTHPQHSTDERSSVWSDLQKRFSSGIVDWSGFENYRAALWQKQLHILKFHFIISNTELRNWAHSASGKIFKAIHRRRLKNTWQRCLSV